MHKHARQTLVTPGMEQTLPEPLASLQTPCLPPVQVYQAWHSSGEITALRVGKPDLQFRCRLFLKEWNPGRDQLIRGGKDFSSLSGLSLAQARLKAGGGLLRGLFWRGERHRVSSCPQPCGDPGQPLGEAGHPVHSFPCPPALTPLGC